MTKKRAAKGSARRESDILHRHQRVKNKLVSAFSSELRFQHVGYIDEILPELLHIAMLHDAFGYEEGIKKALRLLEIVSTVAPKIPAPLVSAIGKLPTADKKRIIKTLEQDQLFDDVALALSPFALHFPTWPLAFIPPKDMKPAEAITHLEVCIGRNLDRYAQPACVTMATLMAWQIGADRLKFPSDMRPPDLNVIIADPESESGRENMASVRLNAMSIVQHLRDHLDTTWAPTFWTTSGTLSECYVETENVKD